MPSSAKKATAKKRKPLRKATARSPKKTKSANPPSNPNPGAAIVVPPAFAPIVAVFASTRAVTLDKGWGAGNVVLKVRDKIFAMTVRGHFVAKLPMERVAELVTGGQGKPFEPRPGRAMKEWIEIASVTPACMELAKEAYRYVGGKS